MEEVVLEPDCGITTDAHRGNWHRQVSLLSAGKIEEFNQRGAGVTPGAFGENLVVEGFDFRNLPVGARFTSGDVVLEMTQIRKGVPYPLPDLSKDGGVHHAEGRCFCKSDPRGRASCRR